MRIEKRLTSLVGLLIVLVLSSCSSATPKLGCDLLWACTILTDPDEYRVGVLLIIGAAQNDPTIVTAGRGDPYNYIDNTVRKFTYPGVTDSLEATELKEKFASALDLFATAYLGSDEGAQRAASANLTDVGADLKARCIELGMDYSLSD